MKDIPGYEGLYAVTKDGLVWYYPKHKSGKHLGGWKQPYVTNKGYLSVRLFKDGRYTTHLVHRLVAKSYVPNTNNLPQVNHLDGNKQNNVFTNLHWCTQNQNMTHAKKNKLLNPPVGERAHSSKLTEVDVTRIREKRRAGVSLLHLSEEYSVNKTTICKIARGYTWSHLPL